MIDSSDFRTKTLPFGHGAGHIPVLGFGTLIPDAAATMSATRDALGAGFRQQALIVRRKGNVLEIQSFRVRRRAYPSRGTPGKSSA